MTEIEAHVVGEHADSARPQRVQAVCDLVEAALHVHFWVWEVDVEPEPPGMIGRDFGRVFITISGELAIPLNVQEQAAWRSWTPA